MRSIFVLPLQLRVEVAYSTSADMTNVGYG
jgi:hypothetical protein